jgi:pyruvate ferredoxin oxidoreductase beta subunit/2-oxoisovalerate ferredoxin oxidoreductase beta subunit
MKEAVQWDSPEFLDKGHGFCPGCGSVVAIRHILKEMGEDVILAITAGCLGTNSGIFPNSPIKVAAYNTPFATVAAAATGIRAALDARGNDHTQVIAFGGDGGTFDIGLQALSAAAERNENFIYLCYDNEAYMNTGVQRSSATPTGSWTTTTPKGDTKDRPKKNLTAIMIAHNIPYLATASPAYPEDLLAKFRKAKSIEGLRFFHIISPCPPGWGFSAQYSIKMARLPVQARLFPLYEVYDGRKYVLNVDPDPVSINEYVRMQGRFQYLSDQDIQAMQEEVNRNWEELKERASR